LRSLKGADVIALGGQFANVLPTFESASSPEADAVLWQAEVPEKR
jgi:hypothetical protein